MKPSHAQLTGTLTDIANTIEASGGRVLAMNVNVREDHLVDQLIDATLTKFNSIDAVVNNALQLSKRPDLKEHDLLHNVNARGTFSVISKALPHLERSTMRHMLSISPDDDPDQFANVGMHGTTRI